MKKLIFIGLLVIAAVSIFGAHQLNKPFYEDNENIRFIYRIAYEQVGEYSTVTNYFWIDQWGRPIDFKDYAPKTPISDNEMIQMYLASLSLGK